MNAIPSSGPAAASPLIGVSPALFLQHNGSRHRVPVELQATADPPLRFLVVGACLAEPLPQVAAMIDPRYQGDFVLLNNFDAFPELPPGRAADYDFQVIHLPLKSILGSSYFRLPDDAASHEAFLLETQEYLRRYLANVLKLNTERKLLSFVMGFLVPQQNPLGRLQPRYDSRNLLYFIERLNLFLAGELARRENTYFVDVDSISSGIGKKACQDDLVWSYAHGTTLSDGDHDHDRNRIQPPTSMQHHYVARWLEFFEAVLHEIFAMHRTLRQQDQVKLVAVDLDDTLWRGVAAEGTLGILEGWPTGLMEALLFLKKRGVLLAIISKNDEAFIRANWDHVVQGQLALSDFAAIKINFRSKAENLLEILHEVSLRPESAVMVDDNPVERAAVAAGVPGVRVLGSQLYYLKRILLWSAETQQRSITEESSRRTEMVQGQLQRESARQKLSQEDFLRSLGLRVSIAGVSSTRDVRWCRALELFNKTNQFNTTGVRYTLEQGDRFLASGRQLYVIQAEDRYTQYGIIGAAWVTGSQLDHLVVSCRALGLGIEDAFLAWIAARRARQGATTLAGRLVPTPANLACRPLFARLGFTQSPAQPSWWCRSLGVPLPPPAHVSLAAPEDEEMPPGLTVGDQSSSTADVAEPAGVGA